MSPQITTSGRIVLAVAIAATFAFFASLITYVKERKHDKELKSDRGEIQGEPICPNCLASVGINQHFCAKCDTPLTSHATIDPLAQIYATGDTYRKAANHPANKTALIGMWLIFAPSALFFVFGFLSKVAELFSGDTYADYGGGFGIQRQDVFGTILSVLLTLGLAIVYVAILAKVTKNYIRRGKQAMEKIFTGKDSMEAHFVRNLLEAQGIRVQVLGEMLGAARGELPLTEETRPGVWVNSEDVERAMVVVDEFARRDRDDEKSNGLSQSETWTCSGCGEVVEEQFSACWKCQKPRNEQGESETIGD